MNWFNSTQLGYALVYEPLWGQLFELKMPQMIWHQIAKFKEKDWLKLWLSTTNPRHDNDERMVIIHYFFSVFWENVLQSVQTKSFFQKWLLRQLVHKKKKQFDDSFWATVWPVSCEPLMNVGFTKKPFAQYCLWQVCKKT